MLEPTEAACLVHLSQKMNKQTREAIQFQIRTKKSLHSNRTLMPKENMFHNTLCDQKQVLGAQKVTSGHKNSPSPPLPSFVPPSLWKYFSSAYCEEETQRETKGEGEKTEPLFSRRRYRNICISYRDTETTTSKQCIKCYNKRNTGCWGAKKRHLI